MKTTIDAPTSVLALKRPPMHPGDVLLEEYLKPAALTQVEAARRMGIPLNRLNEIVRGKRGVSADTDQDPVVEAEEATEFLRTLSIRSGLPGNLSGSPATGAFRAATPAAKGR